MELHLILILMICAAIAAVEINDLISSVIALSAAGLGLSLSFLILKAPGLAIIQLVVEILCVIILIRATINKDLPLVRDGRWFFNTGVTIIFVACFLFFACLMFKELPNFSQPLMRVSGEYLANGLKDTGSANIVSAVTLNYRNYDALAEGALLFTAIIGILMIVRKAGRTHEK